MTLKLKTAPSVEPVTLAEFCQHARIPVPVAASAEETDLNNKLKAARRHVEQRSGRALLTQTWYLYLPDWPRENYIELPLGNLQSVAAVTYTLADDTVSTFAASKYHLTRTYAATAGNDSDAGFGRLVLNYSEIWPTETLQTGEPICIELVCGWKDAASVPADPKLAVEMIAAHWVRQRETAIQGTAGAVSIEVQRGSDSLMAPYSDIRF